LKSSNTEVLGKGKKREKTKRRILNKSQQLRVLFGILLETPVTQWRLLRSCFSYRILFSIYSDLLNHLIQAGGIPTLIDLLNLDQLEVVTRAAGALSNIAGTGKSFVKGFILIGSLTDSASRI